MVERTTDTNAFELKPEGSYVAEVVYIREKIIQGKGKNEGKSFTIIENKFDIRGYEGKGEIESNEFKIGIFKSQMSDIFRAVGATESEPGKFKWDDEKVIGKAIQFNVIHLPDNSGKLRENLIEVKAYEGELPEKEQVNWGE